MSKKQATGAHSVLNPCVVKLFRHVHRQFKIRNPKCDNIYVLRCVLEQHAGAGNYAVNPAVVSGTENIEGYCVILAGLRGFIPLTSSLSLKSDLLNEIGTELNAAEIILPNYFPMGVIEAKIAMIREGATREEKLVQGDRALMSVFTIDHLSRLAIEHYPRYQVLKNCHIQIRETVELYSLGFYRSAITVLLPCLECALRELGVRLGMNDPDMTRKNFLGDVYLNWIRFYIRDFVFQDYEWFPENRLNMEYFSWFDERVQIAINGMNYFKNNLYSHTASYNGISGLNRHSIIHGFMPLFYSGGNYLRLINFLNNICFMIFFTGDHFSNFFPSRTAVSDEFTRHLYSLQHMGIVRARVLDENGIAR